MLREAAEQALRSEQADLAVELLEQAYPACADEDDRASVSAMLVPVEWRCNPAAAMRHVDGLSAALRTGRLATGPAALLVRSLLWHGRLDDAAEALRRLAAGVRDADGARELGTLRDWLRLTFPTLLPHLPAAAPRPPTGPATEGPRGALGLLQVFRDGGDDETAGRRGAGGALGRAVGGGGADGDGAAGGARPAATPTAQAWRQAGG